MSSTLRAVSLGDVRPARSRHGGRRSAVALANDAVVVGRADGAVVAFDRASIPRERWRVAGDAPVVAVQPATDAVVVGERGPAGEVRALDPATGACRWRYRTADEVGPPADETRFAQPFVASVVSDDDSVYVAARRYERGDDGRRFTAAIYAFDPDGDCRWRTTSDASPVALDRRDDRLAVAYNRTPEGGPGLVVRDARTGEERWRWDPPGDGSRRVGDVSLTADGAVVASHADYRGYRLTAADDEPAVAWRVALARPRAVGDDRLYAYPNHAHATETGVVFVTGNSYPEEGRETDGLHPRARTAFGYSPDGDARWSEPVGGFAAGLATDGDSLAVPGAQAFRTRDPDAHGLRLFGVADGPRFGTDAHGVVTGADCVADGTGGAEDSSGRVTVAAVEEPVVYHDDGDRRGSYRLLLGSLA